MSQGAPLRATELALNYYDEYLESFKNQRFISVIDFNLHASEKRYFLLDLKNKTVEKFLVAHGKGSDDNNNGYAEKFSNIPRSKASSIGFYQVSETYFGKYGLSVKMDGLSETNSQARPRAIVIHGANYVNEQTKTTGRSWGCPALDINLSSKVIHKVKNGSLLLIYASPLEDYL